MHCRRLRLNAQMGRELPIFCIIFAPWGPRQQRAPGQTKVPSVTLQIDLTWTWTLTGPAGGASLFFPLLLGRVLADKSPSFISTTPYRTKDARVWVDMGSGRGPGTQLHAQVHSPGAVPRVRYLPTYLAILDHEVKDGRGGRDTDGVRVPSRQPVPYTVGTYCTCVGNSVFLEAQLRHERFDLESQFDPISGTPVSSTEYLRQDERARAPATNSADVVTGPR